MTTPLDELARVTRAASDLRAARIEYRAALVAARSSGETLDAIGRAAGTTREAVRQVIQRQAQAQVER